MAFVAAGVRRLNLNKHFLKKFESPHIGWYVLVGRSSVFNNLVATD
jgi:hypothetical protein